MSVILQQAINRFSPTPPLSPDGKIGPLTAAQLIWAIGQAYKNATYRRDSNSAEQAITLINKLTTASGAFDFAAIKTQAPIMTAWLNQQADQANLAPMTMEIGPVTVSTTSTRQAVSSAQDVIRETTGRSPGFVATLSSNLGLPSWSIYAGGAAFVLSIGMLVRGRKRKVAQGVEGSEWWEAEGVDPDVKRIHRESQKQTQQRIRDVSSSKRAALAWLEKVGSWPSSDPDVRKITAAAERRLGRDY